MDTPTDTQNAAPAAGGSTAKSRKGPTRSEVSKSAILEAAREEMAENGWRGFSVHHGHSESP